MLIDDIKENQRTNPKYAKHFEEPFVEELKLVGIEPEFLYESENYKK